MSAAMRTPMTRDEFLAWEERQELRYEFVVWQPVAGDANIICDPALAGLCEGVDLPEAERQHS